MQTKDSEFRRHFGVNDLFMDFFVSKITGKYSFDVIKFDEWLHSMHGYRENVHGSCKDFVLLRFGSNALKFVEGLLKNP